MKHETIPNGRVVGAGKRRPFREPGEGLDEFLFVRSGLLAIFKPGETGRRIVALRFPGECIVPGGRAPGFGIQPLVDSTVEVRQVEVKGSAALKDALRNEIIAQEWLARAGRHDSTGKVAHLLCELACRGGHGTQSMPNLLTQQQLAEITGQTSVNVNRVLADIGRAGLVEHDRRTIRFLDWTELCRVGRFTPDFLEDAA